MDLIPEWVVINDETKKHVNTTSHQRDAGAYHHIPELGIFLGGQQKDVTLQLLTKEEFWKNHIWLVVSTHLKNISQFGSCPLVRVRIKNTGDHHPDIHQGKSRRHSYHVLVYVSFVLLAYLLATVPCTLTVFGTPIPQQLHTTAMHLSLSPSLSGHPVLETGKRDWNEQLLNKMGSTHQKARWGTLWNQRTKV